MLLEGDTKLSTWDFGGGFGIWCSWIIESVEVFVSLDGNFIFCMLCLYFGGISMCVIICK